MDEKIQLNRGRFKMSYEGYSQLLCKKGHHWTKDCYDMDFMELEEHKCPKCNEPAIWENMVDETNGSFEVDGTRIDGFVELKPKVETSGICSACGEKHICEKTYYIPGKK